VMFLTVRMVRLSRGGSGISLYLQSAPEADNYLQSACRKIRGLRRLKSGIWGIRPLIG